VLIAANCYDILVCCCVIFVYGVNY